MNNNPANSFWKKFYNILCQIEDGILLSLLLIMIIIAVTQIILRNLFDTGIIWGDLLVRTLVLWIGLSGAMIASRNGNHIRIDLVARFLPQHFKKKVNSIVELFTGLICLVVAWHSFRFVHMEFIDGSIAFANIPSWFCTLIIPLAFTIIAIRYFVLCFINLKK